MKKSRFKIPKMDCMAEEQLIRTALAEHMLIVWHTGDVDTINNRLIELKLGATLLETTEKLDSDLPSQVSIQVRPRTI